MGSQRGLLPRGDAKGDGGFPHERLASGFADLKQLALKSQKSKSLLSIGDWGLGIDNYCLLFTMHHTQCFIYAICQVFDRRWTASPVNI